jgi:hypothetical protein
LRDGEIGLRGDDHAEGLHVCDGLDVGLAIFRDHFAEIFSAALCGDGPEDVGEIFETEFCGIVQAFEFRFDLHAVVLALNLYFGIRALQEFGALQIDFRGPVGAAIVHGLGGARHRPGSGLCSGGGVRFIDRRGLRRRLARRDPE